MNKLIITGRLTRDAEKRAIPSGTAVLSFSVANNTGYGDKQKTHFFDCSLFGKRAEGRLADFMKKGQQVVIEGEVSLNTYQKENGDMRANLNVFVQNVELTGGKSESSPAQSQPNTQPAPKTLADFDDDIPF